MFYKQRDMRLYPAWAYTLPTTFLRVFYSATEAGVWSLIVYWTVGFAPEFSRCAVLSCELLREFRVVSHWARRDHTAEA